MVQESTVAHTVAQEDESPAEQSGQLDPDAAEKVVETMNSCTQTGDGKLDWMEFDADAADALDLRGKGEIGPDGKPIRRWTG